MSPRVRRFGDQPMSPCIPTDRARAGRANKQSSSSFGGVDRVIYYMEFCQLSMPGVSPCDARTLYDGL